MGGWGLKTDTLLTDNLVSIYPCLSHYVWVCAWEIVGIGYDEFQVGGRYDTLPS